MFLKLKFLFLFQTHPMIWNEMYIGIFIHHFITFIGPKSLEIIWLVLYGKMCFSNMILRTFFKSLLKVFFLIRKYKKNTHKTKNNSKKLFNSESFVIQSQAELFKRLIWISMSQINILTNYKSLLTFVVNTRVINNSSDWFYFITSTE